MLTLEILNIGSKNEDVELKITNDNLKLDINEDFELSNDVFEGSSRFSKKYNIWIDEKLDETTYPIEIVAAYGGEKGIENIDLVVKGCENVEEEPQEEEVILPVQQEVIEEPQEEIKQNLPIIASKVVKNIAGEGLPTILVGVLGVLVLIMIVLGVVVVLRK